MSEIPEVFAIFEQKLAHVLSFNLRQKGQKKAIEELLVYFSGIVERASKAEARIAELEEKQRWIPVSERLPEIGFTGLCQVAGNGYVIARYAPYDSEGGWTSDEIGYCFVSHWMPLPPPPEEE